MADQADIGSGSDLLAANRNYFTAGQDDSYYRAGLEVPAWGHTPIESLALVKVFEIPLSNVK